MFQHFSGLNMCTMQFDALPFPEVADKIRRLARLGIPLDLHKFLCNYIDNKMQVKLSLTKNGVFTSVDSRNENQDCSCVIAWFAV